MNWILIGIILIGLYFISLMSGEDSTIYEGFTTEEIQLAEEVATYLRGPNTYPGYARLLIAKNNKSTNLAKISTYRELIAKGSGLVAQDVLDKLQ